MFGKLLRSTSQLALRAWERVVPKAASTAEHAAEGAARNAGRAANTAERAAEKPRYRVDSSGQATPVNDAARRELAERTAASVATPTRAQIALARKHGLDPEDVAALSPQARAELARGSTMTAGGPQIVGGGLAGLASSGLRMLPKWAVSSISALALGGATVVGGSSIYTLLQSNPDNLGPLTRRIVNMGDKFLPGGDYDAELSGAGEIIYNRLTTDADYLARIIKDNMGLSVTVTKNAQGQNVLEPNSMNEIAQKLAGNSFFSDTDVRKAFGIFVAVNAGLPPTASPAEIVDQLAKRSQATIQEQAASAANAAPPSDTSISFSGRSPVQATPNITSEFKSASQFGSYITQNNELIGLNGTQLSQVQAAWNEVAGDGKLETQDRAAFEARIGRIAGLDSSQKSIVTEAAFSGPAMN